MRDGKIVIDLNKNEAKIGNVVITLFDDDRCLLQKGKFYTSFIQKYPDGYFFKSYLGTKQLEERLISTDEVEMLIYNEIAKADV